MNLQLSQRRQSLPVRLGSHGYRLDGDFAVLEAELHIPPQCSGSTFGLELWACSAPYSGGSPIGTKVAEVPLELPTPITPYVHRIEARAAAHHPAERREHAMVLMLVSGSEARRVHDFANFGRLQRFSNPSFDGAAGYRIDGEQVVLSAEGVANPRPEGNVSGTLCLELWALSEPYAGGAPQGQRLAAAELGSVWGQYRLPAIERRAPFTPPPAGRWHLSLLLREWTLPHGYATRDYRNFDVLYEQAGRELDAPRLASPSPAAPAAARASDTLRLIEPAPEASSAKATLAPVVELAAPVADAAAPVVEAAAAVEPPAAPVGAEPAPAAGQRALLSVHAASLDELCRLPGVSLKVAKEIVKGRPYASLDALLQVRGIGEKTLRRIKNLLSL